MREIKFRAWDKKSKKMRQLIKMVFNTGFMTERNDNSIKLIWAKGYSCIEQKDIMVQRENGFELMQYTGLHDKNGKEIYEGDIIQYEDITKGLVRYSEKYAQYVLVNTGSVKDEFEALGDYNMEVFEIIGNEFDNPDLLEKGA